MRFVRKDEENQNDTDDTREGKRREAWRLGATLALVLTLHNLPEGVAVGLSTVKSEVRSAHVPAIADIFQGTGNSIGDCDICA